MQPCALFVKETWRDSFGRCVGRVDNYVLDHAFSFLPIYALPYLPYSNRKNLVNINEAEPIDPPIPHIQSSSFPASEHQ